MLSETDVKGTSIEITSQNLSRYTKRLKKALDNKNIKLNLSAVEEIFAQTLGVRNTHELHILMDKLASNKANLDANIADAMTATPVELLKAKNEVVTEVQQEQSISYFAQNVKSEDIYAGCKSSLDYLFKFNQKLIEAKRNVSAFDFSFSENLNHSLIMSFKYGDKTFKMNVFPLCAKDVLKTLLGKSSKYNEFIEFMHALLSGLPNTVDFRILFVKCTNHHKNKYEVKYFSFRKSFFDSEDEVLVEKLNQDLMKLNRFWGPTAKNTKEILESPKNNELDWIRCVSVDGVWKMEWLLSVDGQILKIRDLGEKFSECYDSFKADFVCNNVELMEAFFDSYSLTFPYMDNKTLDYNEYFKHLGTYFKHLNIN